MHNSPRLALNIPDGTDNISVYPADAAQFLGVLDNAVLVTEGTLASRPAANTVEKDHLYRATDTGLVSISNGTAWVDVCLLDGSDHVPLANLSGITTAQLSATAGITDGQLASPNNSVRRLLFQACCTVSGLNSTGNYVILEGGGTVLANSGTTTLPAPMWAGDSGLSAQPQDFEVANKTAKARVRVSLGVNAIAPGVNISVGLFPLTGIAGNGNLIYTIGAQTSPTLTITAPAASTAGSYESIEFNLPTGPATNPYVFVVATSGTPAGNCFMPLTAQLYAYAV